ncbi:fructosamine kinase [Nocardioides guangzhouensis]|uniref:Fructosamine kinase n=1 Tax=Nocardioides guangzhouensis TaxID=2497878 RepID=A0A4Q4ZDR9_9ACTN|nr:fructosamine kinase family protein [Nocardioides guangzhouensis]RYP85314.1 fructosamine kinase [Nocardioides guangzhouensis]
MTRQSATARRAEELLGAPVVATAPVAGGDICTATRLKLSDGRNVLMKTLTPAPAGFFEAEARGLAWLAESDGVAVPSVLATDDECVLLPWIETGKPTPDAAVDFGRRLAATHAAGADGWGALPDGFIGRLPLPNATAPTWAEFYATRRVLPYLKLARDRGHADAQQAVAVEGVVGRIGDLVPDEPPARLHGDLWNGNVLWGGDGTVSVIDPAAYAGHREVDLAMLALFGLPHLARVVDAYQETAPLAEGFEDRVGLHQLFPLLVHAAMFGGGYAARAAALAGRF